MRTRGLTASGYEVFNRFGDNKPGMGIALRASIATADADPGEGFFAWNAADQGSATFLYVSAEAADGTEIATALAGMVDGQRFQVTQADDTARWQSWRMTGAPVSATTYYKLPVALVAQSAGVLEGSVLPIITGGNRGSARGGGALVVFDITSGGGVGGASPVLSVNGATGVVVLDAGDVGADPAGTAAAAIAAHEGAADPHTQYLTQAEANALYQIIGAGTGNTLISGGGVAWVSGLDFIGQASSYTIQGVAKTATQTSFSLAAADATNPRIDAIVLNSSGNWAVITGTPSATPARPDIDPQTQLEVTFVYVAALATTPSVSVIADVYHENVEWTTSRSGTTFTLASTNNPNAGTVCVEGTLVTGTNYVQFQAPTPIDPAIADQLVFYIRSKATWPATRSLGITLRSAGTQRGSVVNLAHGTFGFDSSQTATYQLIVIPMALFGANGLSVNQLRMTHSGTGGTALGMYIDDVELQGGAAPQSDSDRMRWRGTWAAASFYALHDVIKDGAGDVYIALQAGSNNTPASSPTFWQLVIAAGGTPAGANKQIQYNNAGAFGAEAGFEYDPATNVQSVPVVKVGDGAAYDANKPGGEDPHWIEIVNNPSSGAGKQFFRMVGYNGNSGYGNNMHFERAGGTEAAPTAVPDACYLMSQGFRGYTGAGMSPSKAAFQVVTTQAWTAGANGCKFRWEVTPNGSTTRALGMELYSTGLEVVGSVKTNGTALASTAQTTECISGYIATVADKTYKLVVKIPHGATITETTTISESGTCTATFKINTTALGGTANSVSSSEQSQAHASANIASIGDDIQLTTSANAACLGLSFTLKYSRALA